MSTKQSDEIFSVAVLIDNLKHDDASERQKSVQQLERIARAIGPRRAKDELVPFLCECCDDDDEVLLSLVRGLRALVPLLGDGGAVAVFEPLRLLAQSDSKVVRDAAVAQMTALAGAGEQVRALYCQVCEQLLDAEYYNLRQSGVQMAPTVLDLQQKDLELRSRVFNASKKAATDPLPMVRRQVAEVIGGLAARAEATELLQFIRPTLRLLLEDAQDAVRAVAIRAVPDVIRQAQRLNARVNNADLIAYAKDMYAKFVSAQCAELSWRARYVCADLFSQVLEAAMGFEELSPLYTAPRETQDSYEANEAVDLYGGCRGDEAGE